MIRKLLTECRPEWLRYEQSSNGHWWVGYTDVMDEAQGLRLRFPHHLAYHLAFANAPAGVRPLWGLWHPVGTRFEDLTLTPAPPYTDEVVRIMGWNRKPLTQFTIRDGIVEEVR